MPWRGSFKGKSRSDRPSKLLLSRYSMPEGRELAFSASVTAFNLPNKKSKLEYFPLARKIIATRSLDKLLSDWCPVQKKLDLASPVLN